MGILLGRLWFHTFDFENHSSNMGAHLIPQIVAKISHHSRGSKEILRDPSCESWKTTKLTIRTCLPYTITIPGFKFLSCSLKMMTEYTSVCWSCAYSRDVDCFISWREARSWFKFLWSRINVSFITKGWHIFPLVGHLKLWEWLYVMCRFHGMFLVGVCAMETAIYFL